MEVKQPYQYDDAVDDVWFECHGYPMHWSEAMATLSGELGEIHQQRINAFWDNLLYNNSFIKEIKP